MRFFSHLILYLRLLQQPLPDVACNEILSAYVQVLEMAGEDALVAMYASSLEPQSATVSYAAFLKCKSEKRNEGCRGGAEAFRAGHGLFS